ncbi:alpha/beta hydrolase [Actinoplanes sp. NPDC049265]|uniref:alpha/beta hydrolase n=1 Tax=Actinoplanes sp. NPDC049265 TaxID=3363902 RepID=UPI00371B4715
MPSRKRKLLIATLAGVVFASAAAVMVGADAATQPTSDVTGRAEKARVDSVPTPKLNWVPCNDTAECATVQVPLDYDQPRGASVDLAVLKIKAKDPSRKIGSLFINPGGPGLPGTQFALDAPSYLSAGVLDRFDVVGFDPRGIGGSTQVRCFASVEEQTAALAYQDVIFPFGATQEKAFVKGAKTFGAACSANGPAITGAMSTAEVVRDMDVLRRAVGDAKLSYLGRSYGTVLGQYYANMFPDRVRAVAVDGVIDPTAWVGNTKQIMEERLRAGAGAHGALVELLKRCDRAGETKCAFAAGDPVRNFDTVAKRLQAKPLELTGGEEPVPFTYADFINEAIGGLLSHNIADVTGVTQLAADVRSALDGGSTDPISQRLAAEAKAATEATVADTGDADAYDNSTEALSAVTCTDALHPADAGVYPAAVARVDRQALHFGRLWGWNEPQCARNSWTVRDEDAYTGPFNRRTAAPVLVVGTFLDPVTNYAGAVSSSKLLPNSRLLSSNNWGHTAYGSGTCVTTAVDTYLLTGKPPAAGKICSDAPQPFTQPAGATGTTAGRTSMTAAGTAPR